MELCEILLKRLFKQAVTTFKPDFEQWNKLFIQRASNEKFGDYQTNFAMTSSGIMKQNPRQTAQNIVDSFHENELVEKLEIAGPGFINIYLKNDFLTKISKNSFNCITNNSTPKMTDVHTFSNIWRGIINNNITFSF